MVIPDIAPYPCIPWTVKSSLFTSSQLMQFRLSSSVVLFGWCCAASSIRARFCVLLQSRESRFRESTAPYNLQRKHQNEKRLFTTLARSEITRITKEHLPIPSETLIYFRITLEVNHRLSPGVRLTHIHSRFSKKHSWSAVFQEQKVHFECAANRNVAGNNAFDHVYMAKML